MIRFLSAVVKQINSARPVIFLVFIIASLLLSAVMTLHFLHGIPIGDLTRDRSALMGVHPYVGLLSNIGILFWCGAATICLFSAVITSSEGNRNKIKEFLYVSGVFTLVLYVDDLLRLHESVFPFLGIPEEVVLGMYAIFCVIYLLKYLRVILETDYVLLALAFGFFGLSVMLDLYMPEWLEPTMIDGGAYLVEDGAKLVGIVSWLAYFARVGLSTVDQGATSRSANHGSWSTARQTRA